jgi:hypothetical protein
MRRAPPETSVAIDPLLIVDPAFLLTFGATGLPPVSSVSGHWV